MGAHTSPLRRLRFVLPMLALSNLVAVSERVDGQLVPIHGLEETSEALFLPKPREDGAFRGRELEETEGDQTGHGHDQMQDEGNVREQGDNKRRRHEEKEAQPSGEQDGERESEEKEQPPPELGSHEESFAPPDVQPEQAAPRAASITSECLRYHNLFRVDHLREHALQPLHAHSGMDRYAVALMERVAASNCAQRSLPRDIPFGVNFYATSGTKPSCSRATHLWYRGIDSFHGRYPGTDWNRGSGLQFIQMMWSRSEYVACARTQECTSGMNQILCLYYPPGNDVGEAPFSKQTWDAILLRHLRWLDYGSPGARQEPPRAAISELPTGSAE